METEELELYVKPLMVIIPMTKNAVVVTSCVGDECDCGCEGACPDADECGGGDCHDDCGDDCPDYECYDCDAGYECEDCEGYEE